MQRQTEKERRTSNYDEEEEEAAARDLFEGDEEYVYNEENSNATIAVQPIDRGSSARDVVQGEEGNKETNNGK